MRSHSIQQKVGAAVRLSQEQPSDEDQIWQNSTACVDGLRAAVQEKDTAYVKHLAHGAKRDTKLKYRTVVLEVRSRLPRRDRVSRSGVEDLSRPCRGRAQTRQRRIIQIFPAEHVKVKQRAKETQGTRTTQWCWRSYREQRPHTVVLKASADRAVAEFQRQRTVLRVSATRCCKLPDRGVRAHLPRTDDHAAAQYCEVVLKVPGPSAEW